MPADEPVSGRRQRKAVDYARLAAEMFGEGREAEATTDDDWSPRAAGLPVFARADSS